MSHQNKIYAYILTFVPNGTDADDIMQETVTVAWEKFETFQLGTNFGLWIKKIAHLKILEYRHKRRTLRVIFSDDLVRIMAEYAEDTLEQADSRLEALRTCLKRLRPDDRHLLRRRYEEGISIKRIAEQAERSVQGLYKVMVRIHDQLRKCVHTSSLSREVLE